MWEQRHGFPVPERLPSGHRRYSEEDVELDPRRRPRPRARAWSCAPRSRRPSERRREPRPADRRGVHLRGPAAHAPGAASLPLPKRVLVAISHAIEDECGAGGYSAVLIGELSAGALLPPRRGALARPARSGRVCGGAGRLPGGPQARQRVRSRSPSTAPTRSGASGRWSADAPDFTALLSAWELPGQDHVADSERTFEMVWSVEPGPGARRRAGGRRDRRTLRAGRGAGARRAAERAR